MLEIIPQYEFQAIVTLPSSTTQYAKRSSIHTFSSAPVGTLEREGGGGGQ